MGCSPICTTLPICGTVRSNEPPHREPE
ncbi:protein of unknown function (plasmid) [Azospirillum baldaniorum]|uniref:Uncharacterized protein n=1 Tax=Azospirillum baldaniorum TaxID=1064539 RepID=A0A9P1JW02_9PROT|nr:protein of unknown function [Azospirillum baldaniorum]